MKETITLLFLVLSISVASAQDTLTTAQIREDFAYMMEQYERIHPNPMWSLGEERYNELKQQTLAQLDHPMTQLDFWHIIARWNQHFDGHTHVGFPPTAPRMPEGMMAFPPYSIVQYRDGKLRFSSYDGMPDSLRGCEITSIDGHPATEIVDSILPYISHESEAYLNTIILRSLYFYYNLFYDYRPQMTFAYHTTDGEQSVVLDRRIVYEWLVQVGDNGGIGAKGPRDIPWHFSIFPEHGVVLFEFNTCGPNDKLQKFDSVVAACIDSVNHYGIRHLFVDISHNSGGNDAFCRRFLCHISGLPDTVAVMDVTNTEMGTVTGPGERRLTMSFTPKHPLYGGKLYFIQSQFTYSAAILLANMAKQYRLGPVIGEESGGLTTTFTRNNPIMLPNSGLTFYCSDKQFRHIGTTGSGGVLPDIPLEIGYNYLFRSFTPEELQQMIETTQSEQWKTYLDICKQLRDDMTACEKMELYARMDSLFDGYIPVRQQEMNYMEAALQCGDTATFKRLAFRVVRWKGWNPLVFYYTEQYKFLKDCDWWPELDSIQQAIHGRKDYSYAETLYQMEQEDQAARRAFNDPDHTHTKAVEDSLSRRIHEVDSVNLAKLVWLVDTLGFPSWDRVCSYGAHAAWLIAQHAHPWFQYGYVKQMRKAVADTNADPSNLAYLEDRLRTGRGLPQLYGTQFASTGENNRTVWQCPIADIKNVNLRREQMLMPPLEDYVEGYLKTETEQGLLDSDTPLTEMGDNYVRYYYLGDQYSLLPLDKQEGVTDAVAYTTTGDYCTAIPIFCSRLSHLYPFVRDLKHYLECLQHSECVGDQYCYISHYEVLERMVLCGYEPDAWLDSLPDTLTVPLRADYANLREEYLRYLNHEDDAELTAALANRADFETLLRSGKNYHRYELDAWNHAYPLLQKMTDELTKGDYEEFFTLLWREVERGNLHAEDYASLYDRTYYRLHGKDWYGTLSASDKHIRTAKQKTLNERRRAACLPLLSFAVTTSAQTPTYKDYRKYSLNLRIEGDTLRVSGFYLIPYDTTTYSGQPIKVDTAYSLPLADYRTADGAIVLRREGNWYPHINGELLTAQVHIKADDYYIIGGTEWLPSFDIHLVLLPKDKYACKVIDSPTRPFHFYRLASDTTQYPDAYYREFVDSYNFYCTFFGDSLSSKPMNIVEIGDPQFVMCQGLRDMIIFGHYFYDVYTMIPDFSWIPHEVAHQWWGDGIFFEYRDYALSESLNEYIKLQYLKSRGRGYEEQMEYYKAMMERAEKTLPIADIRSVESQDESIAIYHAAPYRLTFEDSTSVNTTLQKLYSKYKHTVVSREVFLQECKALQDWLKSE